MPSHERVVDSVLRITNISSQVLVNFLLEEKSFIFWIFSWGRKGWELKLISTHIQQASFKVSFNIFCGHDRTFFISLNPTEHACMPKEFLFYLKKQ